MSIEDFTTDIYGLVLVFCIAVRHPIVLHLIPTHHACHYLQKFLLNCEFADMVLEVGGPITECFITPEWEQVQHQYARSAMARESGEEVRQPARVGSEESMAGSGDELNVGFTEQQQSEVSVSQSTERVMGEKVKEREADAARQVPKKNKMWEAASEDEKEEDVWCSDIRNKVRTSSKNRKNCETVILGLSNDRETELL